MYSKRKNAPHGFGYNLSFTLMSDTHEAPARQNIDQLLTDAGWSVQSRDETNITAGRGVAIREGPKLWAWVRFPSPKVMLLRASATSLTAARRGMAESAKESWRGDSAHPCFPSVRQCVMVIVRLAAWLIAPAPLADADTETVLVPSGVPGFPPLVLPPLHEVSPDATIRSISTPRSCKLCSAPLRRRAAIPNIIARTGNRSA